MNFNIFLRLFVSSFILLFSTYSWALYPEKETYIPKKYNLGVYLGLGVGISNSNTFGNAKKDRFTAMYRPEKMLSSGVSLANIGVRFFDFRFEGEYSNFYQWYKIINDTAYHTNAVNSNNLPIKGQEALTGFAFNSYYDMRFISQTLYPYIGFGVGSFKSRYISLDFVKQPNGLGENLEATKKIPFYQLMVGMQYDLKVVKSSFSVEYRLMKAGRVEVLPQNDGLHDIQDDKAPGKPGSLFPNAEDWKKPESKTVSSIFHSIVFTFKYYLY